MDPTAHVDRLVWDDWNRDHIAQHAVMPEEAEAVIAGDPIVRSSYKNRLVFTGPTSTGRMLTIVAGPVPDRADVYYVFSARPASREERAAYQQQKGGLAP